MANKTGQNLIDDARMRSGYQNTSFVTDPEVLNWVNDYAAKMYDIINAQDENIYTTPYAFAMPDSVLATAYTTATLGTPPPNYAALPSNMDRVQGLDFFGALFSATPANGTPPASIGQARPTVVHMFSVQERNSTRFMYKAMGRIAGTEVIQVVPFDQAAGGYQLWYIPQFVPLTISTSLDNIMQRFNEYVSLGAGMMILSKAKRRDALASLREDFVAAEKRVRTMSNNRDSEAEQGGTAADGHYTDGWPFGRSNGRTC
jgi:hypothetical protein